ncbi:MAG: VIT family protein [Methylacidiphilales bacterium]|nr:VIT family protein [Candidatus Methylacidiphilales bacterium]MDW8350039.1 VIT family protein [Verrucomicrobiae bacterium]
MSKQSISRHVEKHRTHRTGWIRAAVLGANDGIVSIASLVLGVGSADVTIQAVQIAGIAGTVAGAISMAAGEYVSVSSQADTERADLVIESRELEIHQEAETEELAQIYVGRGLEPELAREVARQLMAHDALGTHAREEIGITDALSARPMQAAMASGLAFAAGAAVPLISLWFVPEQQLVVGTGGVSLFSLACLGGLGARAGGAPILRGILRAVVWGAFAMAATAAVGHWLGVKGVGL